MANFPHLDGLFRLADRVGVDIQPTLLRVLTDLYIQKSSHTADEEQHFTELALRLIDVVDEQTRMTVVSKLADYPAAPAAVTARLMLNVPERFFVSPAAEIDRQINTDRPITTQASLDRCPPQTLRQSIDESLGQLQRPPMIAKVTDDGKPSATQAPQPAELSEIFFAGDARERRLILIALEHSEIEPAIVSAASQQLLRDLETAAFARDHGQFTRRLQDALGLSTFQAKRMVQDASGEPMITAAKAVAMPLDMVQRMLLVLDPAIGRSVSRVYELSALYEEITRSAALRLISLWRGKAPVSERRAAHRPLHWENDQRSARDVATPSSRTAGRPSSFAHPASRRDAR